MAQNPYEPPEAPVADPVAANVPRPPEVALACRILWIVFVLGFVTLLPSIRGEWWMSPGLSGDDASGLAAGLVMALILSALFAYFVWWISRGRNWARWALLAYLIFGLLVMVADFPRSISETPIAAVLDVVMAIAEVWACHLLFRGPGAAWFSPKRM